MTAVAEATLRIGELDGVLAEMFARRLALHERTEQDIGRAWRRLVRRVDVDDLVRGYRDSIGVSEARDDRDAEHEALAQAAAIQALYRLVEMAYDEDDAENIDLVRRALEKAIRSGRAEGMADAVMMAAEQLDQLGMHTLGLDFRISFEHAYRALETQADRLAGESGRWLADILNGQAKEVGQALARVTRVGGSYADMVKAVGDVLTGADGRAVRTTVDLLTSRSMSQGALDLYAAGGIGQVDFVTAGDERVCPVCGDYEIQSPWSLGSAPTPGIHPFCRCVLMPSAASLSAGLVGAYLGDT